MDFNQYIRAKLDDVGDILIKKNKDYGGAASRPPVLAPSLPPDIALKVRLSDKIERLAALNPKNYEPITDTIIDAVGYLLLMLYTIDKENNNENLR